MFLVKSYLLVEVSLPTKKTLNLPDHFLSDFARMDWFKKLMLPSKQLST